jgi:hypothetical protein
MKPYIPDPEVLGRRRFPDNKSFRKTLQSDSTSIQTTLQSLMPSNYPNNTSTNVGLRYRVIAREFARINLSMQAVNLDKQYLYTRPEYLQQDLGERLFLSDKIAPANYNDESYRNYLQAIKSAYLKGSKKKVIEAIASYFTGMPVRIKELYLEARDPGSSVSVVDTHKMVVDVFIDNLLSGYNIETLKSDLDFFINLTRPAHVLYDTRLIWTEHYDTNKSYGEIFGDTGGGCIPKYDVLPLPQPTFLAQQIFIQASNINATGQIQFIDGPNHTITLTNSDLFVVDTNDPHIYDSNGKRTTFSTLMVGQYVRINYQSIPGSFQFYYLPPGYNPIGGYYTQFYPEVYQRSAFQEFVKKHMDSHGRFPDQTRTTSTTLCDRWVQDTLQPLYEDIRGNCSAGSDHSGYYSSELQDQMKYPRQSWPTGPILDLRLLGNDYYILLPNTPLTDGSSHAAGLSDISVQFDGTTLNNALVAVDASSGNIQLTTSDAYWDASAGRFPIPGDEFLFNYHYLSDTTNYDASTSIVWGIGYWQMPQSPLISSNGSLADTTDVSLQVDGISISNTVASLRPLIGHVTLEQSGDFWRNSELGRLPQVEDVFKFSYNWGDRYIYPLLFDDNCRYMDMSEFTFDMDSSSNPEKNASQTITPVMVGYRWRAFQLHHSSVMNSPDTLNWNDFQKPATRASIINQSQCLNHFKEVWSPEFLNDKNDVVLNDAYLDNGLDPVLKLREGIPPFQKTFSYQPKLIYERKVQDIRTHHHPLLYSDMLLKEFPDSGQSVPLSSICDSEQVSFGVSYQEDPLNKLKECCPWIYFDTVETDSVNVTLSDSTNIHIEYEGVPDLRIPGKKLRTNLILREVETTGTALIDYIAPLNSNIFYLPQSIPYEYNGILINFPALPVMHDSTSVATTDDIIVKLDGVVQNVIAFDPYTGMIEIPPMAVLTAIEQVITLTQTDINRGYILLPGEPLDTRNVTMTVLGGGPQYYGVDFYVYGNVLVWFGSSDLSSRFSAGDQIRVSYIVVPSILATVEVLYRIKSSATLSILNTENSRIMDDGYVFGGLCPNGAKETLGIQWNEFFNFLSDYSEGIKYRYFKKNTASIEEHVFSGPVFEYYSDEEDQIGTPDSMPEALVRIKGPFYADTPLKSISDYTFLSDKLVRFRKKVIKELLPDRTFRTTKIDEMLPV